MFHLQYRPVIAASHVLWADYGQSFATIGESDIKAIRRRYSDYRFRLVFRVR